MDATTIGVDLAKRTFQVAIADRTARVVARYRFTRSQFERFLRAQPPTHVVMEACGTAHFWGRLAREQGHDVSLVPPQYVRPYVQRNKTDRADADAVLEAFRSRRIHPVAVKTVRQQELLALHRVRQQWMTTRTARINAIRGLLLEQGVTLAAGVHAAMKSLPALLEDADTPLPTLLRHALYWLYEEVRAIEDQVADLERELARVATEEPVIQRLMTIPGIGLLTATALVATVGDIYAFRRARRFASWLGLTPNEHSTGACRRLGAISKQGDVYLRCLLTHGARAVLIAARRTARSGPVSTRLHQWALSVEHRRGHNKTAVAIANKLARIVWAVWTRDVEFQASPAFVEAA